VCETREWKKTLKVMQTHMHSIKSCGTDTAGVHPPVPGPRWPFWRASRGFCGALRRAGLSGFCPTLVAFVVLVGLAGTLLAQVPLSPWPSLALGQPPGVRAAEPRSSNPNLVEGRELFSPQAVAVDPARGILYVADTGNNRVLGWLNVLGAVNGARADIVIGQPDFYTTSPSGPGAGRPSGLNQPTGLAVDAAGNLWVVDAGNNRVLRFRRPYEQPFGQVVADFVLGQPTLNSTTANFGGLSARSVDTTASGGAAYRAGLFFDREGNLWFTDAGNHRVLRYPAAALAGQANAPDADLVLGQPDFVTNTPLAQSAANRLNKSRLREPSSVAMDAGGRLYVSDGLNRVLVFEPPFYSGKPAARLVGISAPSTFPITATSLGVVVQNQWFPPEGVFVIGDKLFVVDTGAHRILRYPRYEEWPPESLQISPSAEAVIGQDSLEQAGLAINRGRGEPGPDTLAAPAAGAYGLGRVFVADTANHRVLVFPDLSEGPQVTAGPPYRAEKVLGQVSFEFRTPNLIEGREFYFVGALATAAGVALDTTSDPPRLYVADPNNHRVLGFADARRVRPGATADLVVGQVDLYRSLVNSPTNDPTRPNDTGLFAPVGVAVDAEGNLWVADSGNGRVLRFPRPFDNPTGPHRADLVIGQPDFFSRISDPTDRTLATPFGIAFTVEGHLVVSDPTHNRVLLFARPFSNGMQATKVFGQPSFTTSSSGAGLNQLNSPRHIAVDADDRLYVCDSGNGRVVVYARAPAAPSTNPDAILVISGLQQPQGVFVNRASGEIWVAEAGRNRVLQYPAFSRLISEGVAPSASIPAGGPLALVQDPSGNLIVADSYNRVAFYYPRLVVTNAANYLERIAPGTIASLFYRETPGIPTQSFDSLPNPIPLPTELGGVQVLFNEQPARLYFVSPSQTNFLVPNDAPVGQFVEVRLVRAGTGEILAATYMPVSVASPGLFTRPPTGSGQVAAINRSEDPTRDRKINSATDPVRVGEIIELYGTGAGYIPGAPPDGTPASSAVPTPLKPVVILNSRVLADADVQYSGLAPGLVGVWQINIRIPDFVPSGDAIPLAIIMQDVPSTDPANPGRIRTTIAVRR